MKGKTSNITFVGVGFEKDIVFLITSKVLEAYLYIVDWRVGRLPLIVGWRVGSLPL